MQRSNVAEMMHYDPVDLGVERKAAPAGSSEVGDLWRILWCRRRLILASVLISSLGTLLYLGVTRTEFTATAQILIDPRDRQIVTKDVTPDTLAADGGVLQVESQSRVIESDEVLLRAVRRLNLAVDPDYGVPKSGVMTRLVDVFTGAAEEEGPAAAENRALRVLRKHLAVKRADKVFVVELVVTAYSGVEAARIADAIAEAYLADDVQSRSDASVKASKALASRLVELRKGVEDAADQIEHFKVAHDLLGTEKQLISDQRLNDNGTQLDNAQAKVNELQARADQLDALRRSGADAGAVPEAIQSTVITQLRASQSELTRRRSDMRTRFGDRYPDLIALDAEIGQTRLLINAELDRLGRSAHSDLDRAKKTVQALGDSQDTFKRQTISSNQAFVALQELVRQLDARRSVYQAFLARADETREQSGIDSTNARIISRAIPPVLPSWPLRAILLLAALGGGLGLGAAIAFVVEYLAPTLLSAGQLEAAANAPVVGIVAGGSRRPSLTSLSSRRRSPATASRSATALRLALSRLCGPLAALKQKPTPRTILVVSAHAVKRAPLSVAARMVRTATESGIAVLLVETVDNGAERGAPARGFLELLNGECTLKAVVSQDPRTGIFRLGPGTPDGVLGEAFGAERLNNFFNLAGRNFDLIIFDGDDFATNLRATPLAAAVDDVVLIAGRGTTPQKEAVEITDAILATSGRSVSAALLVDHLDRL